MKSEKRRKKEDKFTYREENKKTVKDKEKIEEDIEKKKE